MATSQLGDDRPRVEPFSDRGSGIRLDAARSSLSGRTQERAWIERLLDDARGGTSGVLLLRGEAGIGKSALLEYAVAAAAADVRVLRAHGVEAESPFLRAGFPELAVPGLDAAAALGLLGDTSMRVVERLVSATGGNPLALVELSSELTAEQLAGSELLAEPLPAIRSIRDAFERRLRA